MAFTRREGACRRDGEEVDELLTGGHLLEEGARLFIAWAETSDLVLDNGQGPDSTPRGEYHEPTLEIRRLVSDIVPVARAHYADWASRAPASTLPDAPTV